jgi:5-methylcytosine-specific restriction endonuclease McrA
MTYKEKLQSPKWQKKRLEILQRDNFQCVECGDTESQLHVHHIMYKKGLDPWDYENELLNTLCSTCHELDHIISKQKEFVSWMYMYISSTLAIECYKNPESKKLKKKRINTFKIMLELAKKM